MMKLAKRSVAVTFVVVMSCALAAQAPTKQQIRDFYQPRVEKARHLANRCQAALYKQPMRRTPEEVQLAESDCGEHMQQLRNFVASYREWERLIRFDQQCRESGDADRLCPLQRNTLGELEAELVKNMAGRSAKSSPPAPPEHPKESQTTLVSGKCKSPVESISVVLQRGRTPVIVAGRNCEGEATDEITVMPDPSSGGGICTLNVGGSIDGMKKVNYQAGEAILVNTSFRMYGTEYLVHWNGAKVIARVRLEGDAAFETLEEFTCKRTAQPVVSVR